MSSEVEGDFNEDDLRADREEEDEDDEEEEGEEEEGDEDDSDEGDVVDDLPAPVRLERPTPPPRRPPPPPRPRGPVEPPAKSAEALLREAQNEQFESIVRMFNANPAQHKIQVLRVEPERDVETGTNLKGLLGTFDREVDEEFIKQNFGGGLYDVFVRGPNGTGRGGSVIKARLRVNLPGPPILPLDLRLKAEKEDKESVMRLIEKTLERETEEKKVLREEVKEAQNSMFQLLAATATKKDDDGGLKTVLAEIARKEDLRLQAEREERARQEAARRQDEERREKREAEAREERRREDRDREDRRREDDKKREDDLRRREEKEREDRRREDKEREDRARADREAQKQMFEIQMKQFELQLKQTQELAQAREQAAREEMRLMLDLQKEHSKSEREMMQKNLDLLRESMKDQNKGGIMAVIEQLRAVREFLDPTEPEEPKEKWEKALDKIGPMVMGLASGFGRAPQLPPQEAQPQSGPPQLAPNSVVVAESDEEYEDDGGDEAPSVPVVNVERLKEFPEKYVGTEPDVLMVEIIQRLDLCVSREASTTEAFMRVIVPLPSAMKAIASTATAEQMLGIIAQNVPDDWPVKSAAGEALVQNLFKMIAEKAMKGELT